MIEDCHKININECLNEWKTLRDVDDKFTAKVFGFGNVENYYNKARSSNVLHAIKTKTLFISALDDPVTGCTWIPYEEFENNDNIIMMATNAGGHVGYFSSILSRKQWFTQPVFKFFNHIQKSK